jgi:outer membrane immunogenic protein
MQLIFPRPVAIPQPMAADSMLTIERDGFCKGGDDNMRLFGAAALAFATLASGAAFAADMPLKAPAAPMAAPAFNWNGIYIGGNGGWANQRTSGTSDFTDTLFAPASTSASNPQQNSSTTAGAIGGGQIGVNWQVAPTWVLGAEGDFDWLNTGHTFCRQTDIFSATNCTDNAFGVETVSSQAKWLATARGRVGVIVDGFLFYATGGAAWGSIQSTESLSCLVDGCGGSAVRLAASSTSTQTKSGWVAGVGSEAQLVGNWTVKVEYLHVDLGTVNSALTTIGSGGSLQSAVWSHAERFDMLRFGLNYHFNWGGPVVAKY